MISVFFAWQEVITYQVGDFKRFASAEKFAAYLGLVPGEDSSGKDKNRLSITKAGNRHIRLLLTEAAHCYCRGQIGFKSKALKARQSGNTSQIIAYADKANERLRRKFYKMVLNKGKKHNVAATAIARELACFMWGMMTDNVAWCGITSFFKYQGQAVKTVLRSLDIFSPLL